MWRSLWRNRAWVTFAWVVIYGFLRAYWWGTGRPWDETLLADIPVLPDVILVGLCVLGALAAFLLTRGPSTVAIGLGSVAAAGLVGGCLQLGTDVVALIPALGFHLDPIGFLVRVGCLTTAVLIGRTTYAAVREMSAPCPRCGARHGEPAGPTRWGFAAGYLAVAGCVLRFADEAAVWKLPPLHSVPAMVVFATGLALAGTLLPLALVHRWGRIWPRWVPFGLAGRRVPRWLVLGPGLFVGIGLTGLFGSSLVSMVLDPPTSFGDFGLPFLWVAISAYTVWGIGLLGACWSYFRSTRPGCMFQLQAAHNHARTGIRMTSSSLR